MRVIVKMFKQAFSWKRLVFLVLFLVALLVIFKQYQAKSSAGEHLTQIKAARTSLISTRGQLNGLPAPSSIVPGDQDSVLSYIISRSDEIIKVIDSIPELPNQQSLKVNLGYFSTSSRNLDSLYASRQQVYDDLRATLEHHKSVLIALKPILEYKPEADFLITTSNADKTNLINEAREGLRDIERNLGKIPAHQNDSLVKELRPIITSLLDNLEEFNDSKDTERWYKDVRKVQVAIIESRQAYWDKTLSDLQKKLSEANSSLAALESALKK